ncbi:MAG: holo-ACP synthase [Polyangiales bacterium]
MKLELHSADAATATVSGIGVDVCDIRRVERSLARYGKPFVRKILREEEWSYCARYRQPAPQVAARFAAKEAVFKALGVPVGIVFRDVEVHVAASGAPRLRLHGVAATAAAAASIVSTHLSLTHDAGIAIAFVVLSRGRRAPWERPGEV